MSEAEPREGIKPVSLEAAKVVHVDHEAPNRTLLEDTLREIGFQHIATCDNLGQFVVVLGLENPDLVFVDIDAQPDIAYQTIRGIRDGEIGGDPFVVVVALTGRPGLESVEAALAAGADDMVVKPVSAPALRQRVVTQIDSRKEFIATDDYLGPDRRAEARDLDDGDLVSIVVPNALRFAATGDAAAAPNAERIQETLHNLSIQKFYHLSQKIARIAGQQRDLMARSKKVVDSAWAVHEVSAMLAEADLLIGKQDFQSVTQIVASAREALEGIRACGEQATSQHFDLLQAHGNAIGVVLKESSDSAGVLVSALENAVCTIKAEPGAPAAAPAASAAAPEAPPEPLPAPGPEPEPEAADQDVEVTVWVRLRAWWNGVDPQEIGTSAQ
jgi:CheY-like chemotaxis protein